MASACSKLFGNLQSEAGSGAKISQTRAGDLLDQAYDCYLKGLTDASQFTQELF